MRRSGVQLPSAPPVCRPVYRGFCEPTVPTQTSQKSVCHNELWARQTEAQLDRGGLPSDSRALRSHTLADLLRRYETEIVPRKRSADREVYLLRVILRHPIARVSLHLLTATEIAKYRDQRLTLVKGATVRRELAIVRHCIEVARNEWGFALPSNPVQQVKMPRPGNPRQRRAQPGELEKLLKACEASRCRWLPAVIQMAVETGMRRGELLAMRWDDVDLEARTVLLRNTKNGHPRTVPRAQTCMGATETKSRCFGVALP
jgi:integrase